MNDYHRENMKKHIAFLRDNADAIRKHFNMKQIVDPKFIGCGTSACSLGWACVSVGYNINNYDDETFKVFGINDSGYASEEDRKVWAYCFDFDWFYVNNTPEAAAARLEAVLYNQVPEDWKFTKECAHPIVIIPEEFKEEAKKLFVKV